MNRKSSSNFIDYLIPSDSSAPQFFPMDTSKPDCLANIYQNAGDIYIFSDIYNFQDIEVSPIEIKIGKIPT